MTENYEIIQKHLANMYVLLNEKYAQTLKNKKRRFWISATKKEAILDEIKTCETWLYTNYKQGIEDQQDETVKDYFQLDNPYIKIWNKLQKPI